LVATIIFIINFNPLPVAQAAGRNINHKKLNGYSSFGECSLEADRIIIIENLAYRMSKHQGQITRVFVPVATTLFQ